MKIGVMDWASKHYSNTQTSEMYNKVVLDILVQLLYEVEAGKYILNFDKMELEFKSDNDSSHLLDKIGNENIGAYGDLILGNENNLYSSNREFCPLNYRKGNHVGEKDAMFFLGMIVYLLVSGDGLHPGGSPTLIVRRSSKDPYFSCKSSLNDIIEGLTRNQPEDRWSADYTISYIAKKYPSTLTLRSVEKTTGIELKCEKIELRERITTITLNDVKSDEISYLYEQKKNEFEYKRVKPQEKILCVSFESTVCLNRYSYDIADTEIGVDIGSEQTRIVKFYKGKAMVIDRFATSENIIDSISKSLNEKIGIGIKPIVYYSLSESVIHKYSFTEKSVTPIKAMGSAWIIENDFKGRVLLVDGGEECIRLGCAERDDNGKIYWFREMSCSGGKALTDSISDALIKYFHVYYGIDIDSEADDSISAQNMNEICETSRKIRNCIHLLDKNDTSSDNLILHYGQNEQSFPVDRQSILSLADVHNQLQKIKRELMDAIKRLLYTENWGDSELDAVVVSGSLFIISDLRDAIKSSINSQNVNICQVISDITIKARGAVLYNHISSDIMEDSKSDIMDYGILRAYSNNPIFPIYSPCSIINGNVVTIKFTVTDISADEVKHNDGYYIEKISCRDAGWSEVVSPVGIDGEHIRPFGKIKIRIPEKFNFKRNKINVNMEMDKNICDVTAIKKGGLFTENKLEAEFVPYK